MDWTFTVVPITPTGRTPNLVIRLEDSTNLVVSIESEVAAQYALEESSDLVSWNRVRTAYTLNRTAACLLPLSGMETNRFYRAVWLSY
jgi:hypothetical protein